MGLAYSVAMLISRELRIGIRNVREIVHFVIDALQNSRAIHVPVAATSFPKGGMMAGAAGTQRERAPASSPRRMAPRR